MRMNFIDFFPPGRKKCINILEYFLFSSRIIKMTPMLPTLLHKVEALESCNIFDFTVDIPLVSKSCKAPTHRTTEAWENFYCCLCLRCAFLSETLNQRTSFHFRSSIPPIILLCARIAELVSIYVFANVRSDKQERKEHLFHNSLFTFIHTPEIFTCAPAEISYIPHLGQRSLIFYKITSTLFRPSHTAFHVPQTRRYETFNRGWHSENVDANAFLDNLNPPT